MREVPRLVSDSHCSSVLLSDGVLTLPAGCGAAGGAPMGAAGAGMCMLGETWNRPTVTDAHWTSDSEEEAFGFGLLVFISGMAACKGRLKDDKVLSGLSGGDGERSEFELETSDCDSAFTGDSSEYEAI